MVHFMKKISAAYVGNMNAFNILFNCREISFYTWDSLLTTNIVYDIRDKVHLKVLLKHSGIGSHENTL